MSTIATATRPMLPNTPNGMVDLPAHEFNAAGVCVHCRYDRVHDQSWESYDAYVDYFWESVWEGERGHKPQGRELYEWLEASCGA